MGVLYIAIGNQLRGDDGVAHRVLELITPERDVTKCSVLQLTPELACEVAQAETVVFIDADVSVAEPFLEPVGEPRATPLGHAMTPGEVVYVAKRLYGFTGEALVCHVPAAVFEGERISEAAEAHARAAAALVSGYGRRAESLTHKAFWDLLHRERSRTGRNVRESSQ